MLDTLTHNETDRRYELSVDDHLAYANYELKDNLLKIEFVFAAKELRGKGVASKLMHLIMAEAKGKDYMVEPLCGYAKEWLKRHSEYDAFVIGN